MNKIIAITGCMLVVLFSSCKRSLDVVPPSSGTTKIFYLNQEDFLQGVAAVYNGLRAYPDRLMNLSETRSDNLYAASVLGTQPYDAINSFRRNAVSNVYVEAAWNDDYNAIFRANYFLEQLELKGNIVSSEALRNRLGAEVRFLRAFYYFDLVRYFGKVPLVVKTVLPGEAVTIPRTPVAEVYAQIIEDLKYAMEVLPASYTGADVGRATRYAAGSLLAMVYMARSGATYSIEGPGLASNEWTEALKLINEVINSKVYTFNTNYANIFSYANQNPNVNKEAVFDVMHVSGLNPVLGASFVSLTVPDSYFTTVLQKPAQLGGAGRPTSFDLYRTYDTAVDVRAKTNFLLYYTALGIPGNRPYLRKYMDSTKVPVNIRDWGINFMAIRYTDVLMLKAECILQGAAGGTQAEVDSIVNLVRTRAKIAPVSGVTLEQLYQERRRELVGEGSRWFDLQRSGTLVTTMNNWIKTDDDLKQIEPVVKEFVLYPVPQSQLDVRPGLYIQNQGY